MARGGKRSGAGRKRGSKDRYDKTIAAAAAETGQTPLDIMLHVARKAMLPGRKTKVSPQLQLYAAVQAAAYCHAKLQAIAVTQTPPVGDAKPWLELDPLEQLEVGRRVALILGGAGKAADDLQRPPAPSEPPRLPFTPQPEPEPRVERPEPASEHAVEVIGRSWPLLVFERAARVNLAAIPRELQPEIVFDVNGERPVPMVVESPQAYRERLVAAGFDLERATLRAPFGEPQRPWVGHRSSVAGRERWAPSARLTASSEA